MEARVVAAGSGWQWLAVGYALFRRNPVMWLALTVVLAMLWAAAFIIPVLGPLLFNLLSPALFAGLMVGCRALERGEPLEIAHLFAGIRQHAAPLVTVGGVYLVGTVIVVGIVLVVAGGSMLPAVLTKPETDIETLRAAARSMMLALAIGAAAYMPVLMMIWFAPMLVVFNGLAPVAAMKLSFTACVSNTVPFLVYGAAVVMAWIVLSLPAALGPVGGMLAVALLVASIPVLIGSVYASYRDIFAAQA
ncbi:MAG TPA: BPSS1780 family membrane protein [Burkholderiales bacterium]|nr:BPSS1780 family membrane protein [Burkholderiales bacterium]